MVRRVEFGDGLVVRTAVPFTTLKDQRKNVNLSGLCTDSTTQLPYILCKNRRFKTQISIKIAHLIKISTTYLKAKIEPYNVLKRPHIHQHITHTQNAFKKAVSISPTTFVYYCIFSM